MQYDCFIVDDELAIAQTTSEYFQLFGLTSTFAVSRDECLSFFEHNTASILLLDINLGTESGFLLCKELRETLDIPILFISARTSDDDILTALSIGGDDYIKKPFSLNILLAKVKAILKRYQHSQVVPAPDSALITAGQLLIDTNTHRVTVRNQPVKLKDMEYRLLLYLVRHPNRVISKDELLTHVWKDAYVGEGTISVHIRHLREKLEHEPNSPEMIKTVWGTGYLFEPGSQEPLC